MARNRRAAWGRQALAIGLTMLAGCHAPPKPWNTLLDGGGPTAPVTAAQQADAQIALGRAAEMRGDLDQAKAAYLDALRRDRSRADAHQRLAVLHDKQGRFRESAELYRRAIAADPGNPDIYCDMGYSLYLQRRWAEAEMNLRQAIALDRDHRLAHNNLGLVLARNARPDEAAAEFRKGGSAEAEARENVAFALTTERRWDDARRQYRLALRAAPGSASAKARLKELDALVAKVDRPGRPAAPLDGGLITASATVASPPAAPARPAVPRAQGPAAPAPK